MTTHTHRGHCQFCLHVHAIDVQTGRLAKHGYNVVHGYFRGQCPGSGELSLHVERHHTDLVILGYRDAEHCAKLKVESYEDGSRVPGAAWDCYSYGTRGDGGKYWRGKHHQEPRPDPRNPKLTIMVRVRTMLAWSDANDEQRARQLAQEIENARRDQSFARCHAEEMTRWAARVFDAKMPAYRNEDLDDFLRVGDTVHLGGKKNGYDCKVEAVEAREYTTHGFMRGRQTIRILHARVTRPAIADTMTKDGQRVKKAGRPVHTYWEPVRNIAPPKGSLVEQLKTAGLL